ncbi:MAG: Nramp family divalent metal transporter [Chitinophagaceae bacterium]|nr:Nramp family divalent metal transporter [Chitinophagaceae bacterium]MCW5926931.1 Nramp family divalent metal transporter [Chitinophagaceae bacterium]
MIADNYAVRKDSFKQPPATLAGRLRFLGPGFILSASIVGSGELIATTILGAQAGFVMFWIILVSCFVKVAIQLQFGRQAILTGETVMHSFNKLPGMRMNGTHWSVWTVLLLTLLKIIQVGGMLGGSALVLHMLFPQVSVPVWVIVLAAVVSLLVYKNYYPFLEKASLFMLLVFTVITLVSLAVVQFTVYAFTWQDVVSGLQFELPAALVMLAIGAFGITGVGSDEIISYNYWCLEKGYAAYTGANDGSAGWKQRAAGWIRVMYLDATVAMVVYTAVTAAFYLLGASILHGSNDIPEGNELINVLANIYTQTLGENFRIIFLVGAFFVLFSSVFATLAYWSRLFSDIAGQKGWINFSNTRQRKKLITILSFIFPFLWAMAYLFIKLPVLMIISGGVVGSVLLLIIVYAAICFRYKTPTAVATGRMFDILLWISVISILTVAVYGVMQLL